MNGTGPLLPHNYNTAQIQKKDNTSLNQSLATAIGPAPANRAGMSPLLGPENTLCECPFCNASIKTAVQYTTTSRTHIAAALWCLACCLCCVPYGSDSAKNADHYCPSCHRYLGTYEK
ncbi:lipopolysaccharide-induced tumor necrosis factor-alpha factor homolog isoform X2 [Leguminivora glycinivorella]|nr:lipopolysaccharide-induced tumor necrosis factor-alpha factor homolog isoform X2 [Leguminivora glycinivorella]